LVWPHPTHNRPALLPAIGIAGIDRLIRRQWSLPLSGRAVEARGDCGRLVTENRHHYLGICESGRSVTLIKITALSSLRCAVSVIAMNPEGRQYRLLAKSKIRFARDVNRKGKDRMINSIPFSAQTRMSGVDMNGIEYSQRG